MLARPREVAAEAEGGGGREGGGWWIGFVVAAALLLFARSLGATGFGGPFLGSCGDT